MTSRLLEALVARSSLRPRVQQSPESFGKYIGSINFANHCWATKGSVRDQFYSKLKPEILRHLDGWFGSVSSEDWVTLSVYMIGKTEKTASPTVLFISENDCYRKEARKVIKDSGILKQYPGFKTAHVSKDPGWGEQLEQLASGQGAKTSIQNNNPVTEVFYERPKSLQPVGMPIYIRHGSSMRVATANAIRLQGRLFYLAPCHAFFDRLHKSDATTTKPDDFEIDSDSETEYDDELEVSITSIGSQSSDAWSDNNDSLDNENYSASSDIFSHGSSFTPMLDAAELINTTAASPLLEQVNDKLLPFAKAQVYYLPRKLNTPPLDSLAPLGVLVNWSVDQDWALVEVVRNGDLNISSIFSTNLPDLSTAQIALLPQDNAKIVTYTASSGQITGTIAGTPSYTRVPRGTSFQEVFSINLNGPLADGDCGSAVFDATTGELFGHIVAGCRTTGFAYVMAAYHVFPELKKFTQQIKGAAGRLASTAKSSSATLPPPRPSLIQGVNKNPRFSVYPDDLKLSHSSSQATHSTQIDIMTQGSQITSKKWSTRLSFIQYVAQDWGGRIGVNSGDIKGYGGHVPWKVSERTDPYPPDLVVCEAKTAGQHHLPPQYTSLSTNMTPYLGRNFRDPWKPSDSSRYSPSTTRTPLRILHQKWADDAQGGSILWLHSIPGTGKSAICRAIVQSLANNGPLGVSLFFPGRGESERGNASRFFTTIATTPDFPMRLLRLSHNAGWTPLSWAAGEGHKAMVDLLLAKDGVDPDSKDSDRRTPLFYAAENGHEEVAKLLLARDRSARTLKNIMGGRRYRGRLRRDNGDKGTVIPDYLRPCDDDENRLSYNFEASTDLQAKPKVWETARAISAAPKYFKLFSQCGLQEYYDGGLYHNNPASIALSEMKNAWPQTFVKYPDILISIGTGYSKKPGPTEEETKSAWGWSKSLVYSRAIAEPLSILKGRLEQNLDSGGLWLENFKSLPKNHANRYVRLSPYLSKIVPGLDDVAALSDPRLKEESQSCLQSDDAKRKINAIARRLVTTSFYFHPTVPPTIDQSETCNIKGYIRRRFLDGSEEIKAFADVVKGLGHLLFELAVLRQTWDISPQDTEKMRKFRNFKIPAEFKIPAHVSHLEITPFFKEFPVEPISGCPIPLWKQADRDELQDSAFLPHLIIVINSASDSSTWDPQEAKAKMFAQQRRLLQENGTIQQSVRNFRDVGASVESLEDLLKCCYSSINCVWMPNGESGHSGVPLSQQLVCLRNMIGEASAKAQDQKAKATMLLCSQDRELFFKFAFNHHTSNLDEPFDFLKKLLSLRPLTDNHTDNFLKALKMVDEEVNPGSGSASVSMSHVVAVLSTAIASDTVRSYRVLPGNLTDISNGNTAAPNSINDDEDITINERSY